MKKIIFKLLRYSGLPFLFREIIQKNKVSMILFHDISRETADQSFNYLSKNYNVIDLNDFIDACKNKNQASIPKKAMIVTFDDGHLKNYDILPEIQKYKIPVTIFLCTSIVNTNRHFWFEHEHPEYSTTELKRVSNKEKLKCLSTVGFEVDKEYSQKQAMTKEQILLMKNDVNMQSHTVFHPILPMCDDAEARMELFESKRKLEEEYNFSINTISYPNGDYSDRDISLSKEAGYECGVTVDYGFNTVDTDIFKLKRLSVNDSDDMNELIVKASGLWAFIKTRNGKKQIVGHRKSISEK